MSNAPNNREQSTLLEQTGKTKSTPERPGPKTLFPKTTTEASAPTTKRNALHYWPKLTAMPSQVRENQRLIAMKCHTGLSWGAIGRHTGLARVTPSGTLAMARILACLYYRLVTKGQAWVDRGAAEFERKRQQRELLALQRKAHNLGMQLVAVA